MSLTIPARSTPARAPRAAVSVEELRRAWVAVQAGDFRGRPAPDMRETGPGHSAVGHGADAAPGGTRCDGRKVWVPTAGEQVLPVLGCAGSAGTTTVALAVAVTAEIPARVVECCSGTVSGLAAASHAELGQHESGWRQGRRDHALLERVNGALHHPQGIPTPTLPPTAGAGRSLTVVDGGWDLEQLLADPSWLNDTVQTSPTVIAVATATVPGLRRLETALELLGADRTIAALLGPRPRRWPKAVTSSAGPRTRDLLERGRFQAVPVDRGLAVHGLDSRPLPPRLLHAAAGLLTLVDTPTSPVTSDHAEGTTTT